jgi:hypothetical protein
VGSKPPADDGAVEVTNSMLANELKKGRTVYDKSAFDENELLLGGVRPRGDDDSFWQTLRPLRPGDFICVELKEGEQVRSSYFVPDPNVHLFEAASSFTLAFDHGPAASFDHLQALSVRTRAVIVPDLGAVTGLPSTEQVSSVLHKTILTSNWAHENVAGMCPYDCTRESQAGNCACSPDAAGLRCVRRCRATREGVHLGEGTETLRCRLERISKQRIFPRNRIRGASHITGRTQ